MLPLHLKKILNLTKTVAFQSRLKRVQKEKAGTIRTLASRVSRTRAHFIPK
jgi:hypothetical protein